MPRKTAPVSGTTVYLSSSSGSESSTNGIRSVIVEAGSSIVLSKSNDFVKRVKINNKQKYVSSCLISWMRYTNNPTLIVYPVKEGVWVQLPQLANS
jgi:hypothetical protein